MGSSARWRLLFLAAALAFAALSPQPAQAASMPLLSSCQPRADQTDSFSYRFCSGYVASFDGVQLDTDLTMPAGSTPSGGYPSDLGHPLADNNKFSEWRVINRAATAFFDLHVRHSGGADPAAAYQEQIVRCDSRAGQMYASATASGAAPGRVAFQSSQSGHATVSAPTDPAAGVATDPIAFAAQHSGNGGCVRLTPAPPDSGASTSWTFPICADFTLLGEPALHLNATLLGTDAEINSRLWDIAPDGSATLVTRGAYRRTGSGGAASVAYALLGSGWKFAAGHQLRIQVTQNDVPYLRLDNYQSSAVYSSMQLTLPTTASIGC